MKLLNGAILGQPYNWLIIGLMAAFWLLLIVVLFPQPGEPGNAESA